MPGHWCGSVQAQEEETMKQHINDPAPSEDDDIDITNAITVRMPVN